MPQLECSGYALQPQAHVPFCSWMRREILRLRDCQVDESDWKYHTLTTMNGVFRSSDFVRCPDSHLVLFLPPSLVQTTVIPVSTPLLTPKSTTMPSLTGNSSSLPLPSGAGARRYRPKSGTVATPCLDGFSFARVPTPRDTD
jgi:hypothetical protein